ncbi:hypothetical protein DFH08DRAFT_907186 [Mycena albidolilacea]|uniref:Uncharacterized protein n=1 Tax=Mycena albidolilacea TaxID=1033008 RepID=A0AAD7E6X9_9AGAR|nr:hypothetical protein DFH08DRAFT_907186 [Mycena albidolilacea]
MVYALVGCSMFDRSFATALMLLGLRSPDSILSYVQTPLLFLGRSAEAISPGIYQQSQYSLHRNFFPMLGTWVGFRDYIWVGLAPINQFAIYFILLTCADIGFADGRARVSRAACLSTRWPA